MRQIYLKRFKLLEFFAYLHAGFCLFSNKFLKMMVPHVPQYLQRSTILHFYESTAFKNTLQIEHCLLNHLSTNVKLTIPSKKKVKHSACFFSIGISSKLVI